MAAAVVYMARERGNANSSVKISYFKFSKQLSSVQFSLSVDISVKYILQQVLS